MFLRSFDRCVRFVSSIVFILLLKQQSDESILKEVTGDNLPKILVGEGVINYPFTDTSYLYSSKIFMGEVLFKGKCPTESPSISIPPSFAPSNIASER